MADTNTPNIGLLLPDLGDTFNFALHVENNFSTIDSLMGAVQCTTTTRPSNTYAGQIIYETDSKRYVQNTGTKASPTWTYMSHAALAVTSGTHPTSGLSTGLSIYETDTKFLQLYNGSSFEQKAYSNLTCTSSAHPSSPFTGLEIFETDTGLNAIWNGSKWVYPSGQLLYRTTLGGTAASVTLPGSGSLPQVFNDLTVVISGKSDGTGTSGFDSANMQWNGVSAADYNWSTIWVTQGGAVQTTGATGATSMQCAEIWNSHNASSGRGIAKIEIPNYSDTNNRKQFISNSAATDGGAAGILQYYCGGVTLSAAITSITILMGTGNFIADTTFSVYGH